MGKIRKGFSSLLFAILVTSSLILVESTSAQSIRKPSVPEFNLVVAQQDGNYSEIIITIKNQPFIPYKDPNNGSKIELYYNVQSKEHFSGNWNTISYLDGIGWLTQTNSDYTIQRYWLNSTPANRQVDFRVQAMMGNFRYVLTGQEPSGYSPVFTGETSDWSDTKTLVMVATSTVASPTPTIPEFPSWWAISFLLSLMVVCFSRFFKPLYNQKSHHYAKNKGQD
jgi:hypothetical protein